MKRKQWHPVGAKICTDICARTLKNWFMLSVRLFLLGPVYMEVGGPQVGEVTCPGGVTRLSI